MLAERALQAARDVLSWGRTSTAKDLVRLALSSLHSSERPEHDVLRIKEMTVRHEQRAFTSCGAGVQDIWYRLQSSTENGWSDDEVCKKQRETVKDHLDKKCDLSGRTSKTEECLAVFTIRPRGLRSVSALCRAERPLLLQGFRTLIETARRECENMGNVSATAVSTAFLLLAHVEPDRAAKKAQEMFLSLSTEPDRDNTYEMISLVADALALSSRRDEQLLAIAMIDTALEAPTPGKPPVIRNARPGQERVGDEGQRRISELLTRRLALTTPDTPLDLVQSRIEIRLRQEYSEEARAGIIGLLASSHAATGQLHGARDVATRAGERNQLISIHCRILEHKLARDPERQRKYGLTPDRRWPKPAPTLFDVAPPFTFEQSPPGPLSCAATRNYDID